MTLNAVQAISRAEQPPLEEFDDARIVGKHFMISDGPFVLAQGEKLTIDEPIETSWYRTALQAEEVATSMTRMAGGNLLSIKDTLSAKVGPRTYYRVVGLSGLYAVMAKVQRCEVEDSCRVLCNRGNRFSSKIIQATKDEMRRLRRQQVLVSGCAWLLKSCAFALALTFCWGAVQFIGEQ
jgi:hypothetical protein